MDVSAMLRQSAQQTIQARLDAAVQNGDSEAATKAAQDLAALAVQTAPKAPAFTEADIRAELDKQEWFGVDPKKSAKAVEFGKTMDPKKFGSADAFAKAIVKAVEDEFKPAAPAAGGNDDDGNDDDGDAGNDDDAGGDKPAPKARKTDGPRDGDLGGSGGGRNRQSGPWSKMSDAPSAVQAEIKRQAGKLLPSSATKEQRETFEARSLEAHYKAHQAKKGK